VFAKQGRFEKADVKKQHADNTPTINTHVNIAKNKLPDMIAKDRFMKADVTTQNAENTPPINTQVNIVTGNIKNGLGCQLPLSAHKYLPTPATTPLTR
jgi:hypothetical protein